MDIYTYRSISNDSSKGSGQFSWAEGNHLKIFGCDGICNGQNCNDTGTPHPANLGWRLAPFKGRVSIQHAIFTEFPTRLAMHKRSQACIDAHPTARPPEAGARVI